MEYKIEDLVLYKEKQEAPKKSVFDLEHKLTQAEKAEFIDKYYLWRNKNTGMATYMLNLIDKFNAEKDAMPKDQYGGVKTVSLKAWLKKNDTLGVVYNSYSYGHYYFVGSEFTSLSKTPTPLWGRGNPYYGQEGKVVDYWLHDLLNELYKKEVAWYKDHNTLNQKVRQIKKYCDLYGSFGIKLVDLVGCNGESVLDDSWLKTWHYTKPTEEEIDKILEVYQEVDTMMKAKTKEIQEKLGWEIYEEQSE